MNLYKVFFDDNKAISSEQMILPHQGAVELQTVDGRRIVKWITIYARDEQESLGMANDIVSEFFEFVNC